LEPTLKELDDDALRGKTADFKARLEAGETLDDLLVEAFAVVREAAVRTLGMRHYDVQLIGGIVLHQGKIAEMKTGEGKTLSSTLPVYLNALADNGVHVVTVNDYLASRDADWMRPIYEALGMTVGAIQHNMRDEERQKAYGADITYGTNNEFGFDYLRDNMKFERDRMVQRGHQFAIVDEVDSILIDEARTPLIISGPSEQSTDKYRQINSLVPKLERGEEHEDEDGVKHTTGDFLIDEKAQTVSLTEDGVTKAEKLLGVANLYDLQNIEALHAINQGLRAHHLFERDVDYLIKDGQVVIVDEFTGRMMPGRRWSDGLHQAVEAKEGVKIERENQTLATITFQNYFRMYEKLSGMTGTAETEEAEFGEIYDLDVVVIPTNRPLARIDSADLVYRSEKEKWDAVVEEIRACHENGQPTLVGTISIEKSEMLSKRLKRAGVRHNVLNAKHHGKEASIVAQAGRKGSVTIATNMAGRGTDIVLGGNAEGLALAEVTPEKDADRFATLLATYKEQCKAEREEVLEAGGLHILGTERHESRRIDNQLRGRSGRQGDKGSSRFFLSLEDDLMRIFGSDRVQGLMHRLTEEGEAIEHKMVSRAIERAQTQVEGRNFDIRKHLLKYDDVMNKQREAIYDLRTEVLDGEAGRTYVMGLSRDIIDDSVDKHCPPERDPRDWELDQLASEFRTAFDIDVAGLDIDLEELGVDELKEELGNAIESKYVSKEERLGADAMRTLERSIMLHVVDGLWKDHLLALDQLKEGINLRGYGQRDPVNEYKRESFELFQEMKTRMEDKIISDVFRAEPVSQEEMERYQERMRAAARKRLDAAAAAQRAAGSGNNAKPKPVRVAAKVGRNDPCPCGSGKKYKKCCGTAEALAAAMAS
ncbi:MAG: preprotein translocase subunit SecA, partial [Acidobacteriota bacterium]